MSFETHFSIIPDPRKHINLKHNLLDILFLVVTAILSGAEGWVDIEEFGITKEDWLKTYRPFENVIPSHDTIARVLSILDSDALNQSFINWVNEMQEQQDGQIIAIDGKTLKRSYQKSGDKLSALHSISAYATEQGISLIQKKSQAKKNEVKAVLDIIDELEIKQAIITTDAMSCLSKVANKIVKKGADYVLQLKDNQALLLRSCIHKLITP